jgi:hypothetical protein
VYSQEARASCRIDKRIEIAATVCWRDLQAYCYASVLTGNCAAVSKGLLLPYSSCTSALHTALPCPDPSSVYPDVSLPHSAPHLDARGAHAVA